MLRSSAGNFYNYFRPGAGELIRSAESRRFLSLPPPPLFPLTPSISFFFPPSSISLPAPSSRLSNHARALGRRPFLADPFFHSTSPSSPFSQPLRPTCISFSVSRAIVSRGRRAPARSIKTSGLYISRAHLPRPTLR